MGTNALWLSGQLRVEAMPADSGEGNDKYRRDVFRARREDGSTFLIERTDIIMDEEQAMIDELADIVFSSKNPARHARYGYLMKQLLSRGVPYARWLMKRKPRQQAMDVFDAG